MCVRAGVRSLLSFKVLVGIILLGRAHQCIDDNRRQAAERQRLTEQQLTPRPVSKDDLELLTTALTDSGSAAVALRRTQSLSQFTPTSDNHVRYDTALSSK